MDLVTDNLTLTYGVIAGVLGLAAATQLFSGSRGGEAALFPAPRAVPEGSYSLLGQKTEFEEAEIPELVSEMRHCFMLGRTLPIAKRLEQLRALRRMVAEHESELIAALQADLGRPEFECVVYDIQVTLNEIDELIKHTAGWARPQKKGFNLLTFPSRNELRPEPYGTVLVIGTWNYPIMLTLVPLAGAIAAGNNVVLKPSNVSPNVAQLLGRLVPAALDPLVAAVVGPNLKGDRGAIGALIEQHFDYIFFTGGPSVGKRVMRAAAENLTPCTLELGGKNPCFVAADADVALAAKRLVWGRMMNAGQQCIAPDTAFVHESVHAEFIRQCRRFVTELYAGDRANVGRIVNDRHFQRVQELVERSGGEMVVGGEMDAETRYVAPGVLSLDIDSPAMDEETFAPILFVVKVDDMDEAIRYVQTQPAPLSMYIFGGRRIADRIIAYTKAGGVTVNGTLFHCAHPELPFGGVGRAGMGAYHGKATFDTFSHMKPVLTKTALPDGGLLSDPFFLYPPWTGGKLKMVRALMRLS